MLLFRHFEFFFLLRFVEFFQPVHFDLEAVIADLAFDRLPHLIFLLLHFLLYLIEDLGFGLGDLVLVGLRKAKILFLRMAVVEPQESHFALLAQQPRRLYRLVLFLLCVGRGLP